MRGRQAEHPLLDTFDRGVRRRNFDASANRAAACRPDRRMLGERRRKAAGSDAWTADGRGLFHVMDEEPMSSIRSASRREQISTWDRSTLPWPARSSKRPGAGNQYVNTAGQGLNLRVWYPHRQNAGTDELQVAGIELEALVHLGGEFAGRRQDQHAWLAWAVALGFVPGGHWENSFSRIGRAKPPVLPVPSEPQPSGRRTLQHGGNGPLLHRSRLGHSRSFNGAD